MGGRGNGYEIQDNCTNMVETNARFSLGLCLLFKSDLQIFGLIQSGVINSLRNSKYYYIVFWVLQINLLIESAMVDSIYNCLSSIELIESYKWKKNGLCQNKNRKVRSQIENNLLCGLQFWFIRSHRWDSKLPPTHLFFKDEAIKDI